MSWKRRLVGSVFVAGLGALSPGTRAEDPAPPKPDAPATPAEAPKKKDPFFGDRFAMYLETRGGPASVDEIDNSLSSGVKSNSLNALNFDGSKSGQFTVGWTLPRGRGQYLLTFTGIDDGDYQLDGTGMQAAYVTQGGGQVFTIGFQLPWWQVSVHDGQLSATKTPPVWNASIDDANLNGRPDPAEMRYPVTTVSVAATYPKDLGNTIQTWDLYYRREFGGVRIRSRWTAGIRYLQYDGAIATPAWVTGASSTAGFGYTDGSQTDFVLMKQKTTGWGPVGGAEVDFNFFRQRLTLYALVQAAFLMESLETDSGTFTYYSAAPGLPGSSLPGAGHLEENVSKSAWNSTFEAGLRVKILEGFNLILDWNATGYLDTMLLPTQVSIPDNATQILLGTTGRFISRDWVIQSVNVGLSFQF